MFWIRSYDLGIEFLFLTMYWAVIFEIRSFCLGISLCDSCDLDIWYSLHWHFCSLLICNKASKVNEDGSSDSKPQIEDEMGDFKRFLSTLPLIPIVMAGYVVSKVRSMFKPSEIIVDEYNSVLRIACWEASAWSNSPSTSASTVPHEVANEVTLLEQALITGGS